MEKKYWLFKVRVSLTNSPIKSVFLEVVQEADGDYTPDPKGDGAIISRNVFNEIVKISKFPKHKPKISDEVYGGPTRITKARYEKLINQMLLSNFR